MCCINEYLAIESGGNVSVQSLRLIAAWLECFPEKPRWCRYGQVCQGMKCVKRFERSKGLNIALYKNTPSYLHVGGLGSALRGNRRCINQAPPSDRCERTAGGGRSALLNISVASVTRRPGLSHANLVTTQ